MPLFNNNVSLLVLVLLSLLALFLSAFPLSVLILLELSLLVVPLSALSLLELFLLVLSFFASSLLTLFFGATDRFLGESPPPFELPQAAKIATQIPLRTK